MSHLNSGLLLAYNSLTDKHLTGYFSNTRIRRHLLRAGLITRSGRIVPDKEYRHRLLQRAHQKHVRECLAQAIFHKVLEMERLHRTEIKKKLEEFTRRERVHKIKVQHSKRYEEDVVRVLSPHPPTGVRGPRKNDSGPEGERSESSLSPSSSRPNTAPGKMQRPVRLKPIHSSSTTASVRRNSPYRLHESSHASSQPLNRTMNKESFRASGPKETSFGISPCYLPVINNFVTPIPPVTKRKDRSSEISPSIRGRRLRNATAFSGAEDLPWLRSSIHQSQVCMNMVYFGKTVHLSHDLLDLRDEVKVFQQHCGGENLCVYKGMLREGETFQFLSRRHRGFPFSLTFFLNGLQVERLSACCEFKYRKGSRLGGKHGNFGFLGVEGASPCYKCIIALGLDKMPTPPPKRLKGGKGPEVLATSPKDSAEVEADGGDAAFPSESSRAQNTENQDQTFLEEDKTREDYEEDFEADDEAAAEEAKEDLTPSPSSQTETQGKKNEASETEDEKDDIKSDSDSSFSDSDQEESDVEAKNDIKEEENPPIAEHEEKALTPEEEEEQNPEETAEEEAAAVNSAADSTEVEISDPRGPSGNEMKLSEETPEEEKMAEECHNEEEQDRAKSVQEKLAEAILKQSQCSSEPELSDTSTEEEEEHRDEGSKQASKEEDPEEEMVMEETKCDEGGSAEVSEEQKEIPKIEGNEEEPHDDAKEEETCEAEEGEKGADDEATAEKDEAEEQSEAHLPANGNAAPDDKTTDSAEGDAGVDAENDGERKEEAAVETDYHPNETEQRRESGEEDESSVSEQPKQTDEAAVLDNAEAEAADATMEMKAESSEKQEALSCEEAPEAVTEGEADAEEEAEVTAESSSNQPQEDGDTTAHRTAEEGGGGEDEEHVSGAETGAEHSQQENDELEEEKMVGGDEKTEELKPGKEVEEEEKQTESEEVEEGVNTEEKEKSERKEGSNDESTVDQNTENSAESSAKDTNAEAEVEVEGEKTKEDEAATEEKEEEPEKTGTNEGNDIDEKKKETRESEKDEDESDGGEDRSSANLAAVKKDDGAENSEKDGGEENTEHYETERREETPQVIEEPELREESKVDEELVQISTEIPADVPADEEETASINQAENVQKEDEKGKIEAKNEEIEAPEAEENSSTSHEKDMKTEGQEEEEGKTEEPAEGEDPEEAPEKMKDEVVRETSTVVIETSENKGDDSLKVYDEFTKMGSEASGGEPKERPDESRACEDGDQSDADHQNTTSDLTEKDKDIHNLTETQENPDAGDVGEAENWPDEEEQVLDDAAGDDAPAADGADTEEVSKASEEGASVLLKPHSQHGESGDTGRREAAEAPEVFAREDNTDLVTSWISVHQTSKFFQTFVEPLDDLTDAVVAPNSENKETAPELQRSQSPGKLEAKSEDEEHKQMFRDELEFLEDGSAKTTRQVEEETEAKSPTSPTEPDDKQSPKDIKSEELQGRGASSEEDEAGPAEGQHQEQMEVKSTSGSHHSASTSQPENQLSENATGPDAAAVRTPEAPLEAEKNSQTEESWENAYSRQVTQITEFTTSVSVDGSREEPREEGEEIQRKGLEESFLNKDIQQTLHAEKLSPFSVDETLFAHTSYPLLTEL
ncbi:glutamate-rich protein 3 isoform X2 [Oryzias latipes]